MGLAGKLARAGVLLLTLAVIVGGAAALPWLSEPTQMPERPAAYDTDSILPEKAESEGRIQPGNAVGSGVVLIDRAHDNRFSLDELRPMLNAIEQAGYRVRFVESTVDFEEELNRSKALIVIDPNRGYAEDDVDAIERFVEDGGHVLLFGEPTRSELRLSRFGASLASLQNRLTPITTRFGISYGESYLYNMERNDGNFKNVFAQAGEAAPVDGVERTAFYTAVEVRTRSGEVLLTTGEGTRSARGDRPGEFPVAVTAADGDVIAVGDFTFVTRGNYNVLDNEVFISNLVEFLTSSDRDPPEDPE